MASTWNPSATNAAVGLVAEPDGGRSPAGTVAVRSAQSACSPLMPAPLALKPLWSVAAGVDLFVTTGVHVVPSLEASRNA